MNNFKYHSETSNMNQNMPTPIALLMPSLVVSLSSRIMTSIDTISLLIYQTKFRPVYYGLFIQ